jgi:type III pantothenate kinase
MVVASVASHQVNQSLAHWYLSRFNNHPEFILSQAQVAGVYNAYPQPQRLGIDRWAAVVGAYHLELGAVCVVDCGTAVTVDWVGAMGRHRGGAIMPGKRMMLNSLNTNTSQVNAYVTLAGGQWLGQDTDDCVAAGLQQATLGMIERIHAH